jgi:hypothetical protein
VQTHPEEGSALIVVLAPSAADSSTIHDQIIRNVYRAARTVFGNDNTLTHVTVTVRTSLNLTESRQLLTAEIDRVTALQLNPDTEDLGSLEARLRIH